MPCSASSSRAFDWESLPWLVKERIVDVLSARSVSVFRGLSGDCAYLADRRRSLRPVPCIATRVTVSACGSFVADLVEGVDTFDSEQSSDPQALSRNAATHLDVAIAPTAAHKLTDDFGAFFDFWLHTHPTQSVVVDFDVSRNEAAELTARRLWGLMADGLESVEKLVVHRLPPYLLARVIAAAPRATSVGLLSNRHGFDDAIPESALVDALQHLGTVRRFVCSYRLRPTDAVVYTVLEHACNLELFYVFGASTDSVFTFMQTASFAPVAKVIFSFTEGFYGWSMVRNGLLCLGESACTLPLTTLPVACCIHRGDSTVYVGLTKPYRSLQ